MVLEKITARLMLIAYVNALAAPAWATLAAPKHSVGDMLAEPSAIVMLMIGTAGLIIGRFAIASRRKGSK
ncbi:hypothetical protein [Sphingomonas montanisoli]|uniref:PEP-CTERM sorting domain-containing protein n=1 Tax=Sphingomonas montanisoli TaxID=2606412 RepID=A0A5D9C5B0_9SPHN|nr:hypothetical protein [Sphingomonas montanisoli]TZG26417.1 hypothetical protein FYJ91_15940 [Sphingomonas montanisoli]